MATVVMPAQVLSGGVGRQRGRVGFNDQGYVARGSSERFGKSDNELGESHFRVVWGHQEG